MRTISTNRGAKGRRKKRREKKRRLEREAELEKEKSRLKNSDLFKEDFKAKRRKRSRKERRLEAKKKVDELTAEQQIDAFIEDWRLPDKRNLKKSKKKKVKKMEDVWEKENLNGPKGLLNKRMRIENKTVKLDMRTFEPETYFSYNPSDKQREVGLDAVGAYWDNWTGKDLKREEQHQKDCDAYWEGVKQREAEEEFLGEDSSDSSSVEETGVRIKMPYGRAGKLRSERNREKIRKAKEVKAKKALEEKRFLQEFALIKKYNKMITEHMLEAGARPKKPVIIKRHTANSWKYEPMMPMLLTPEEIEDAKGSALRRLAVHKDNVHELVNRLKEKRILNPDEHKHPHPYKVKKKSYTTFMRIGGPGTGVRVSNLWRTLTQPD